MYAQRLAVLLVAMLLLPACGLAPPLPQDEWEVAFDPLYPPTVWIETDDLRSGGGVIVTSDSRLGTIVLTAHHVVRDANSIHVGIFRHSRMDGGGPEYVLYPAEIVVAGFVLDERLVQPIRELAESYRALIAAADAPGRFNTLEVQLEAIDAAIRGMESSRQASEFRAALDEFTRTVMGTTPEELTPELRDAMRLVSEKRSSPESARLAKRLKAAMSGVARAVREFGVKSVAGYDAAILRVRTGVSHHTARCGFETAQELSGTPGKVVTIRPQGQPRVRDVRVGSDVGNPGLSGLSGSLQQGNSGSPVFVDGRLVGILTQGFYSIAEGPGNQFEEAVFLRIYSVRDWLARRKLEDILH